MSVSSANRTKNGRAAIGVWLLICCIMIFIMVVLGGVTRLTESGLSMVNWRPIMGWLPPLGEVEWQDAFTRYKSSPEFRKVNFWMTLTDFKGIFWFEYIHRLWGRIIGLVYTLPFLYFVWRRYVDRRLGIRLAIGLVLGALQGLLGWVMVQSGLVDRPDVSQYRLAAHLGLAILIYGYLLWIAMELLSEPRVDRHAVHLRIHADVVAVWTFLTTITGAFVAGIDAGRAYNTFPLMGEGIVPEEIFDLDPWIVNFFENVAAVQFTHRAAAILLVAAVLALWLRSPRRIGAWLAVIVVVQGGLGIATLLMGVEIWIAAIHQGVAMLVLTFALWTAYICRDGP